MLQPLGAHALQLFRAERRLRSDLGDQVERPRKVFRERRKPNRGAVSARFMPEGAAEILGRAC
jgi:hypothetical protein